VATTWDLIAGSPDVGILLSGEFSLADMAEELLLDLLATASSARST